MNEFRQIDQCLDRIVTAARIDDPVARIETVQYRMNDLRTVITALRSQAQDRFRDAVADLLDDPSDLLHPYRECEPAEELAARRRIAADLRLDFDELVRITGTAYERKRLADIELGKIQPAPRQPLDKAT